MADYWTKAKQNMKYFTRTVSGHSVECFVVGKMDSVHLTIGKLILFESVKYVGEEECSYVKEGMLHLCDALESKSLWKCRAVYHFFEREFEIWACFGPVGNRVVFWFKEAVGKSKFLA